MFTHYAVLAWAVIATVVPLLVLARFLRARHRTFEKNAHALLLRIGTLSVRTGSLGSTARDRPQDHDPQTVSFVRSRLDACKASVAHAREVHVLRPSVATEALGRIDGILDTLSALLALHDDATVRFAAAAKESLSEAFARDRDALLGRISRLEKEGVPAGAERQLVGSLNRDIGYSGRGPWLDPMGSLSSFFAHYRRLTEVEASLMVRERAWRGIEKEAIIAEHALRAAGETIIPLETIAFDQASAETARGLQARRSVSRIRTLIAEATTKIGVARRHCHPGDGAFTVPGSDTDRLLLATRACAVALAMARVAHQTAVRHRDAQAVANSRRGQA